MTFHGDCEGLLDEFTKASDDGDEDLMVYIDEHADEAGCFPEGSPHWADST